jgi:tartrate dehydratase alpha subunit/fumarate hydratase class I-like protein
MSEKMVRTQVYLPRDIYEQLKERGEREGLTLAHQIREALVEYVAIADEEDLPILTADDPIWNIVGMVESGVTDGSVNHDKYIYARDWDPPEADA